MTNTYIALSTITLATAQSSVTFGSIPQTYRDLVLVANLSLSGLQEYNMRFNGDAGSNYNRISMGFINSLGIHSDSVNSTSFFLTYTDGNIRSLATLQLMDYSATDKHKSFLSRANTPQTTNINTALVNAQAGRWANTAAITQIEIRTSVNFSIGSTFSLYGIAG